MSLMLKCTESSIYKLKVESIAAVVGIEDCIANQRKAGAVTALMRSQVTCDSTCDKTDRYLMMVWDTAPCT